MIKPTVLFNWNISEQRKSGARDLYRGLRRRLRKYSLIESLDVIRAYVQFLQYAQPLPPTIEVNRTLIESPRVEKGFYEWELELLAKELILNAPERGSRSLRQWSEFATTLNKLKNLENSIAGHPDYRELFSKNILIEMYRIAHRQFPWQRPPNSSDLVRYFKIFGHPDLDRILEGQIGLSAEQLYTLGLLFVGHFLEKSAIRLPVNMNVKGYGQEEIEKFLARFSTGIETLRRLISDSQSYDEDYAYSFNPLRIFPLIEVKLDGLPILMAPVPTFLIKRFTEGVYYEICNAPGFAAAFGRSYQEYLGAVLHAVNECDRFTILPEQSYQDGKHRKDTVDWIFTDPTASLFIECKAKRLQAESRIRLSSRETLEDDLAKMSDFLVQIYKTLIEAKEKRYPHWQPDARPVFPIVVTLEDWQYAYGHPVGDAVDKRIRDTLRIQQIDPAILESHPYSICGIADFEKAIQIIGMVGIENFMRKWINERGQMWGLQVFAMNSFPEELRRTKILFKGDLELIGQQ